MRNKNFNGCFYGRQTPNKYEIKKEIARQQAIEYQNYSADICYSYSELAFYCNYFTKLAKKYGLIKEFKENGII